MQQVERPPPIHFSSMMAYREHDPLENLAVCACVCVCVCVSVCAHVCICVMRPGEGGWQEAITAR